MTRVTNHQTDEALAASPVLLELALLARTRLRRYSDEEARQMLAACLMETLIAIDADGIQFQDDETRATLNALLLVAVEMLVRSD